MSEPAHEGDADPHTGGCFTLKAWQSEKMQKSDEEWGHTRIILKPINNDFPDIILEPRDEGTVRAVAEFVCVIPDITGQV